MKSRHQYKKASIQGKCLLYPLPINKNQKYLVEVPEEFSEFYLFALENHFLDSFDNKTSLDSETILHTDNQTLIYQIDYNKIFFDLLKNKNHAPEKAEVILNLLNQKLRQFLSKEVSSSDLVLKLYQKQRKCSTCKVLGINHPLLIELLEYLP